ncbi:intraflagellar transport protein 46 homolog [Musca vetustissima]|uniref:intraflagellar transport protein 46 homolog n=1 Tax=Musca vetustissima TaxID=27455 RepID=UPI002AB60E89|nr:intraflagellar transport protein 46 homolog [Musca vetustissima]
MNYYDEEIPVNAMTGAVGMKPPSSSNNAKVERISSRGSNSDKAAAALGSGRSVMAGGAAQQRAGSGNALQRSSMDMVGRPRQRTMSSQIHGNSTDDDGLLQDILDHDDDEDDDDEEDDSEIQMEAKPSIQPIHKESPPEFMKRNSGGAVGGAMARTNPLRPGSSRMKMNLPTAKVLDNDSEASETDSEEGGGDESKGAAGDYTPNWDAAQMSITPDKWEALQVPQEVKDLFPYILKYIPQHIETAYHLQPFIPDFVPAVGDVDAFIRVTEPPMLSPQRGREVEEHLQKLGLYFLDEPSGSQSEPSLLNMKLRSALTGSGSHARSSSATMVPVAKSNKDIDKWINEVEQVHMTQSVYDVQPRKDIENIIIDWPRSYASVAGTVQQAYQQCAAGQQTVIDYVRVLCQQFELQGPLETQADYLLSVQTLFALYLAANQAWE